MAMGQSEERYRELVQEVGSLIVRLTPSGAISFCNDYAQRFFGVDQGPLTGRKLTDCLGAAGGTAAENLETVLRQFADLPSSGGSLTSGGTHPDGEPFWIAWSLRALRDASGEIVEILCVGNDVTDRKRAEEALRQSEERYALVVKGSNDGIWDWDLRTNTVYFSPRYLEILGYGPEEMPHMGAQSPVRGKPSLTTRVYPPGCPANRGAISSNKRATSWWFSSTL